MNNQIDGNIKKKRVNYVLELSKRYEYEYYHSYIGRELDGVSEIGKDNSIVIHTSNFIPVRVNDSISNNEIVKVKITDISKDNSVYGKVIKG